MFWCKKKPEKSLKDIDFDKEDIHGEGAPDVSPDNNTSNDIPEYVEVKTNSIYIDVGYTTLSWLITPYTPKEDETIDEVWADFLNWFNHKKDEPYFIMYTETSQRWFARRDIRGINIEVTTKKVLKENNDL